MEDPQFNIVDGGSAKKKATLLIILMGSNLIITAVSGFILKSTWIPLISMIVFFIILAFLKKKNNTIKRIGIIRFQESSVELKNTEQAISRSVAISSIGSVHLRNGIKADEEDLLEYRTMFIDFTLRSGEILPVHIEVEQIDDYTIDTITNYFAAKNIEVTRKI